MFTSCSPGWIRYVELHRPELIPHLSTCKSPQQMTGALIREFYPRKANLGERLFSVSIMPCTAKKFEAEDLGDIDAVLTTREMADLLDDLESGSNPKGPAPPWISRSPKRRARGGSSGGRAASWKRRSAPPTNCSPAPN